MKTACVVITERAEHHRTWCGAFAEGLRRHGWAVSFEKSPRPADLIVLWGVRHVAEAKRAGGEICVLERAYLGERFNWTSVSFGGGLNGRGVFRGPFEDPSRWNTYFTQLMKPWRDNPDGYALIMGQVPGDQSIAGVDMPAFYDRAHVAFRKLGIPVKMRHHPNVTPAKGADRMAAAAQSLIDDLNGAKCAITWNSNSAVDAVLAGVPAVAMDRGSMAWDVTGHELTVPPMPDRAAWSHRLAWCQWRRHEMLTGECWEVVKP